MSIRPQHETIDIARPKGRNSTLVQAPLHSGADCSEAHCTLFPQGLPATLIPLAQHATRHTAADGNVKVAFCLVLTTKQQQYINL